MARGKDAGTDQEQPEELDAGDFAARLAQGEKIENDDEIEDVDPADWLSRDDTNRTGHVTLSPNTPGGKRIRFSVAALTESESNRLTDLSRTMDPKNPKGKGKINAAKLRRRVIAYAISKAAHPDWQFENLAGIGNTAPPVSEKQLEGKLTGELTAIQTQILELSGLESSTTTDTSEVFV